MRNSHAGFTLIELLIVIAIIGILAAALIPNLLLARQRAQDGATMAYMRNCITAIEIARYSTDSTTLNSTATTCEDFDVPLSPAIQSSTYTPASNGNDYTLEVTSKSGSAFRYDGQVIIKL